MAVADDVRKCVFFIGNGDEEHFKSSGTAFLLNHDGSNYLVTACHVARDLGDDPFSLRINRVDGTSNTYQHDPLASDVPWFRWYFPENPAVDIAVMPFNVHSKNMGLDVRALRGDQWILDDARFLEERIGLGDICYAVGLFRVLQGARRNVPVIHTGNMALLAGEEQVDVRDWNRPGERLLINAHLVEMTNLDGLSGAPVFVRGDFEFEGLAQWAGEKRNVLVSDSRLHLLGVWHGSWEQEVPFSRRGERIPVGMGIVVPASDLLALLNQADVVAERERFNAAHAHEEAATPDAKTDPAA